MSGATSLAMFDAVGAGFPADSVHDILLGTRVAQLEHVPRRTIKLRTFCADAYEAAAS